MRCKLLLQFLLALMLVTSTFCRGPQTEAAPLEAADTGAQQAPVTIYLVRHAEKNSTDPKEQDPELAPQGHARAESLRALLEAVQVDALYVTKYKRTQQTLKPLADERKLQLLTYESNDFRSLKERLLQNHSGQTVVVAGHSNTLLPLIEKLGANPRISHIAESAYDYIFKVVVHPDKTATVEVNHYGTASY